jgi:hypothetical protein
MNVERMSESPDEEHERLARVAQVRQRAQACGWPGPYRVQVFLTDDGVWGTWADVPNTHDRVGTAEARARALVHGLSDDVRPGWYGDPRGRLGTHWAARVLDAGHHLVGEEIVHVPEHTCFDNRRR